MTMIEQYDRAVQQYRQAPIGSKAESEAFAEMGRLMRAMSPADVAAVRTRQLAA